MKTAVHRISAPVSCFLRGVSRRFVGLPSRRRSAAVFLASSESCEPRCLLTDLPVLQVISSDRNAIAGTVVDNRWDNQVTVEVDLLNDGTVDHTVTAVHDGFLDMYLWDLVMNGEGPKQGYDVALKPISNGVDGRRVGDVVVIQIGAEVNEAPVIVQADIDQSFLSGQIEDDMLGLGGGTYDVEVAVGNESSGFTKWGTVDYEGYFSTWTNAPQNQGVIKVYVRVKETSHVNQVVSNVVELNYDSNAGGFGLESGWPNSPHGGNSDGGGDGGTGDGGGTGGGGTGGNSPSIRSGVQPSFYESAFVRTNATELSLFGIPGALDELLA